MKNMFRYFLLAAFSVCLFAPAFAQTKKTPADAEAMVKKAIEFYKANGKEKALAEFTNQKGKFIDGDLYIFAYDLEGKCIAHGGKPKQVGVSMIEEKDADGKYFVKERLFIIKSRGKGWQNYKWMNPVEKKVEDKSAYIEKVDDVIIGCGAYK